MAVRFDKDKVKGALDVIHTNLNTKVIENTETAWAVFSSIEDDNPQKMEFKKSVQNYQASYNSFVEYLNKFIEQLNTVDALHGQLDKYEVNQVQVTEADAKIEEIDTSGVFC